MREPDPPCAWRFIERVVLLAAVVVIAASIAKLDWWAALTAAVRRGRLVAHRQGWIRRLGR